MGSKNKITLLRQELELALRTQAQSRMGEVLEKAIEMALAGDRAMLKLLIEAHLSKSPSSEEHVTEKTEIKIVTTEAHKVETTTPQPVETTTEVTH